MKQFLMTAVCLASQAAPLAAQAVGALPEKSPYEDLRGGQRLGIEAGYLVTGHDPAGVGPKSSPLVGLRYDFHAGGPAYLTSRLFGASTTRDILDYTRRQAFRRVGTQSSTLIGADGGLAIALTGSRSWHKWQPVVQSSLGFISAVGDRPDVSRYSFGTRFYLTYGLSARYVISGNSELRGDIVWFYWQLKYPETFRSTDGDPVAIRPTGSLSPWTGGRAMTVSWAWGIFR
ncbi:MAG TPA: hypothetical protein VHE78_08950 [Gemmatimonadaceae bacterium]|nr:hypothetical protein [Gemmatimonadaceae bacterium]